MSMWTDFLSKLRKEDLVAKASLTERDAEVIRKAQEIVNEYSKIAGIEPPKVAAEKEDYFFFPKNKTINISKTHASNASESDLRAILAHEVGHAQDEKQLKKSINALAIENAMRGLPGVVGMLAMVNGALPNSSSMGIIAGAALGLTSIAWQSSIIGGYPQAEMREESRADQFAIDKAGIDPLVMKGVHDKGRERAENREHIWTGEKRKEGIIPTPRWMNPLRGMSLLLQQRVKDRLDEIERNNQPERVPSRFGRPPEVKGPEASTASRPSSSRETNREVSSTGRFVSSRFSRPPERSAEPERRPVEESRSRGMSR